MVRLRRDADLVPLVLVSRLLKVSLTQVSVSWFGEAGQFCLNLIWLKQNQNQWTMQWNCLLVMCHPPGALMGLVHWCSTLWTDVPAVCSDVMFHRVNWCAATVCTDAVPPPGHWQLCADWWWLAKLGKMTIAGACYYWFLDITFLFLITMIIFLSGNLISQSDSMAIT